MGEDKPIAVYSKNVDVDQRIRIPKIATQFFGRKYYMQVYRDKIILIPRKE